MPPELTSNPPPPVRTSARLGYVPALDALRGLAAVAVLLGHSRELLWPNAGDAATAARLAMHLGGSDPVAIANTVLLLPSSCAREAVGLFFTLSGFWVGGSLIRQITLARQGQNDGSRRFSWLHYLIARLSRLWIVLIPALILTAIADQVSRSLGGVHAGNQNSHGVVSLLGNLLFLQPKWIPTFGSNVSLWSLSYEFWFYIAFPAVLLLAVSVRRRQVARSVLWALVIGICLSLTPSDWALNCVPWVVGAVMAYLAERPHSAKVYRRATAVGAVLLLVAAVLSNVMGLNGAWQLALVGCLSGPLVFGLSGFTFSSRGSAAVNALAKLGPWSYSLYAYHAPLVILAFAVLKPTPSADLRNTMRFYVVALVIAAVCFILSLVTERYCDHIRNLLMRCAARWRRPSRTVDVTSPYSADKRRSRQREEVR